MCCSPCVNIDYRCAWFFNVDLVNITQFSYYCSSWSIVDNTSYAYDGAVQHCNLVITIFWIVVIPACGSNPCLNGATCFNGPQGGYMCACAMGFEGDDCESGNASLILHTITG